MALSLGFVTRYWLGRSVGRERLPFGYLSNLPPKRSRVFSSTLTTRQTRRALLCVVFFFLLLDRLGFNPVDSALKLAFSGSLLSFVIFLLSFGRRVVVFLYWSVRLCWLGASGRLNGRRYAWWTLALTRKVPLFDNLHAAIRPSWSDDINRWVMWIYYPPCHPSS